MDIDAIVRLNSQTAGRDKLFRLCQYMSRFLWSLINHSKRQQLMVEKLKRFEQALSSARKVLQLGRCIDIMNSTRQTINLPDPVLRITLTFSRIASSLFILTDNIIWMQNIGLINVDKAKWVKISSKLWLYSILMNLVRDLYEIKRIAAQQDRHESSCYGFQRLNSGPRSNLPPEIVAIRQWLMSHKSVSVDTLKNACDVWIPLSTLGHVNLSPTSVGLLGCVSSTAAILQIIDYSSRLSPS